MRVIERKMLEAIKAKKEFSLDNTFTEHCTKRDITSVFLHSNHIGDWFHNHGYFAVNINTLKNWPTRTTISRLRALGVDVCTRKGKVLINGSPLE